MSDVAGAGLRNPVFLTGDWHSTFVNDLKLDFGDPASETIATEFVTPAITTGGDGTPYGPYYSPMIPFNPHIKYYEGDRRGYFKASVTQERIRLDLRFVTASNRRVRDTRKGSWVVEDGQPGAVQRSAARGRPSSFWLITVDPRPIWAGLRPNLS